MRVLRRVARGLRPVQRTTIGEFLPLRVFLPLLRLNRLVQLLLPEVHEILLLYYYLGLLLWLLLLHICLQNMCRGVRVLAHALLL